MPGGHRFTLKGTGAKTEPGDETHSPACGYDAGAVNSNNSTMKCNWFIMKLDFIYLI